MKKIKIIIVFLLLIIGFSPVLAKENKNNVEESKAKYLNSAWWAKYQDEYIDDYVQRIYQNNQDLKIADIKTKQAQQAVKLSFSNELPNLSFNGNVSHEFNSSDVYHGDLLIPDYSQSNFYLPLTATYELDIWGENHTKTKSVKKQLDIVTQDERATYISVISAFVADYYNLIKIDKLIENQIKLVNVQDNIVNLLQKKYKAGMCSITDVMNEEQILTTFKEELNDLKSRQDVLENQMTVIIGEKNAGPIFRANYSSIAEISIPQKLDSEIIQNRPDLIKSEDYIKKIGLDVKAARKDFLPKFLIFGQVGFNSYSQNTLFGSHTFLSNVGVAPSLDLFTGGRKIVLLKYKKLEYEKALQKYEKTILTSFQEVNDSLMTAKTSKNNLEQSQKRLSLEKDKYELSNKKLEIGTTSVLANLKEQEKVYLCERAQISNKINYIISSINVYKAVGGIDYTEKL